jgi:hypothetical protein
VPVTQAPAQNGGGSSNNTPPPVSNGSWAITSRYPSSGSEVGGTMAMINGSFPDYANAAITIGGNNASIFYSTPGTIWFLTPAHAPGVVDITVSAPGVSLTMPNAFTYLSATNNGGGSNSGGGSSGGGSNGGSNNGGNNGGSSNTTPTTAANNNTPTTTAPNRKRGTLTLVRVPSSNAWGQFSATAWPARTCTAANCNSIAVR